MGEHRPSTIEQQKAISESDSTHMRIPICDGLFCIFGISWLTSRKPLKCVFTSIGMGHFMSVHLTFILIHFHFFSLYLCLLSSVRFGSVWCCAVCALFLFYFVFVFVLNLRLQLVFNEKFHRLFSSWNVQIVDAWWLIRNCAASDKKSRTAGSGAFAVLILTHLFDIYVLAKRLRSRDRLGYELEVMNHIVE